MKFMHYFSKKNLAALSVASILLLWAAVDLLVLDRFTVNVEARDATSGEPIPSALVLATVRGDKIAVPAPDVPIQSSLCIGSLFGKTDSEGTLTLDSWKAQRMLNNKTMTLNVVAPGWASHSSTIPASVAIFGRVSRQAVKLVRQEEREHLDSVSPEYRSLAQSMTLERFCGEDSWTYGLEVLDQLRQISSSGEERRRTVGFCKYLEANVMEILQGDSRPTSLPPIPYSCDSSLFADSSKL